MARVLAEFTVQGDPRRFALKRARIGRRGKYARMYDPEENLNAKDVLRFAAQQKNPLPDTPVRSALAIDVKAYFPIPKSFSKAKRKAAIAGTLRPTPKPDVSNLVKSSEDAFNQLYYRDDAQIVDARCRKWYSDQPRLEVIITVVDEEEDDDKRGS